MPRTPPRGPHGTVLIGGSTYPVTLSQSVLSWMLDESYEREANVGSLNSGMAATRSVASQALGTANGAVAGVSNLAGQSLPFSASFTPSSAYGSAIAPSAVTTSAVTVNPVGGIAPYFHSWAITGSNIVISDPSSDTTAFESVGLLGINEYREQTATDTITDSTPGTPLTTQVVVGVAMYGDPGDVLPP